MPRARGGPRRPDIYPRQRRVGRAPAGACQDCKGVGSQYEDSCPGSGIGDRGGGHRRLQRRAGRAGAACAQRGRCTRLAPGSRRDAADGKFARRARSLAGHAGRRDRPEQARGGRIRFGDPRDAFLPETPGGPHTRDAPHVRILVVQFDSQGGARTGLDILHENALQPCPGSCAARIEPFDVSGVPNAKGVQRPVTAERLQETGEEGEPTDSFTITFADGQFVYQLEGFGPPGSITEQQVEDIAKKLHDRVAGAPDLPESTSDCTAADRLWRGALRRRPTRWAMP